MGDPWSFGVIVGEEILIEILEKKNPKNQSKNGRSLHKMGKISKY